MRETASPVEPMRSRPVSPSARAWGRFCASRPALVSLAVLAVLVLAIGSAPWWVGYEPNALSDAQFAPPSARHWLGTDANGRDLLARVCFGARISLVIGLAGAGVSLVIGVVWGAWAGYAGGRCDAVLMRGVDILYAMPSIVFVMVLVATFQEPLKAWLSRGFGPAGADLAPMVFLVVGLGGVSWLTMARIVRGQVRALVRRPFVEASQTLGAGHVQILVRHILPNTSGVILAYLTLTIPAVVLAESFLSYLGLGIQPPQASLGSLIADGAGQINPVRTYWWLLTGPGGVLTVMLLALGFAGDGLRDAFDPRADG